MICPICHSQMNFHYKGVFNRCGVKDYQFSLVKCIGCHFIATDPLPTNVVYPGSRNDKNEFLAVNTAPWNFRLLKKVKSFKSSGDLLEIGCNSGDFLEISKQGGFNSIGIEIDEVASKAGLNMGRNLIQGDVLKHDFGKKFDVIVLNHVVEHIPQINELPKRLMELLKEDGVIIINVPNISGFIVKIMKQNWCQMAPFTHLWFFSKKSVNLLFGKSFQSIKMSTNTNCEPIGLSPFSVKLLIKTIIVLVANKLQLGDELGIVLTKPKTLN